MSIATDGDLADGDFAIEDISTGLRASGFGQVGDGRTFSFRLDERRMLIVEVYRPRLSSLVPQEEDIVAVSSRSLVHVDVHDERSLAAAVRDAVADAQPVPRGNH
ncbi:MAG: hypothetical protein P4L86_21505 [Mycobacterium sp.]|nr:hypothetical protein [Mycobacterium sp.]